jgi:hypothetical protein
MVFVRGQALQHVLEVRIRVMPIEPGALDQAHDGRCALAGPQRARKKPVAPVMDGCP